MKFIQPPYHKRVRVVDIDGTICEKAEPENYASVQPLPFAVDMINHWFDSGDYILLWTARPKQIREFTIKQLNDWKVKYHELLMDKPYTHDMHLYDDNNPVTHYVERNKGIGDMVFLAYLYRYRSDSLIDPSRSDKHGMEAREALEVMEKAMAEHTKKELFPPRIYDDD